MIAFCASIEHKTELAIISRLSRDRMIILILNCIRSTSSHMRERGDVWNKRKCISCPRQARSSIRFKAVIALPREARMSEVGCDQNKNPRSGSFVVQRKRAARDCAALFNLLSGNRLVLPAGDGRAGSFDQARSAYARSNRCYFAIKLLILQAVLPGLCITDFFW